MNREASHAGTWYSDSESELRAQFDGWLLQAGKHTSSMEAPQSIAKILISPHAGYRYSGATAAHAFHRILRHQSQLRRVIVLGPSHRAYLQPAVQQSRFLAYGTPLGALEVDSVFELPFMAPDVDRNEHSLEMQMPFLRHVLDKRREAGLDKEGARIVPLLIGSPSEGEVRDLSTVIYSILQQDDTCLIVSSDFCHWGRNFVYCPDLRSYSDTAPLHIRIKKLDTEAQEAISSGAKSFAEYMKRTENTICGWQAIRVALELCKLPGLAEGGWRWLHYDQSSQLTDPQSTSSQVSYVAGVYEQNLAD